MRADIGGPGQRAPLAISTGDQKRMPALLRRKACQHFNAFNLLELDFIGPQQQRPFPGDALEDCVGLGPVDISAEPFRNLKPVIMRQSFHR